MQVSNVRQGERPSSRPSLHGLLTNKGDNTDSIDFFLIEIHYKE